MKKKIELGEQQSTPNVDTSVAATVENDATSEMKNIDPILDHIQKQDAKINELEGTLKELLTYLQKQQGVQTDPNQPQQQQQQGGGTLDTIMGLLKTVQSQQPAAPTMESRLAEMMLNNLDLTNQYIRKRMIGEVVDAPPQIQHTTVS